MSEGLWRRVEPTETHRVGWRTVVTKHFELPNGTIAKFDTVNEEDGDAAAVIAVTPQNRVVVVNLFRPGPEQLMVELPGGAVDPGEDPEKAAMRELSEETGYAPGATSEVTKLGSTYQQDAYSNGKKHYFMISNVVPTTETKHEVEETIEVSEISPSELIENAKNGRMTDAVAVLMAYERLREMDK